MDIKAEHQGIYKGYGFVLDNGNFTKYKGNAKLFDYQTVIYKNGFFGVLAPGIAYIDVDIREQAEFLYKVIQEMGLKCKVLETTKGKHFIFKDPNGYLNKTITRQYLACGIVADSKSGNANGVEYLKKVGETAERQIIYGKELSISELDELPTFLKPFKSLGEFDENINKDTGEIEPPIALFNDLGEGSRNDTLTRHILALQNVGFTDRDEIRDIIRVINSYFFTDPLEDTELEIILRDDTFIKGEKENQKHCFYDEKGKFLHNIFGDFIINKYEIILYEEELYYFDKGINKYLSLESVEKLERLFINEIDSLKKNIRLEIRGYIRLKAPIKQTPSYNLIPFRNGIYDLKNEKFIPPNKEYVFLNVIPWNYNPKCKKGIIRIYRILFL